MPDPKKIQICSVNDFGKTRSVKFAIPAKPDDREGFVVNHEGKYLGFYNECAHISLPLDWNDNDFFDENFHTLVCKNHGAQFQPQDGLCIAGPCTGAHLKKIEIQEQDGVLYALV